MSCFLLKHLFHLIETYMCLFITMYIGELRGLKGPDKASFLDNRYFFHAAGKHFAVFIE